jgi:hypothetical protein
MGRWGGGLFPRHKGATASLGVPTVVARGVTRRTRRASRKGGVGIVVEHRYTPMDTDGLCVSNESVFICVHLCSFFSLLEDIANR